MDWQTDEDDPDDSQTEDAEATFACPYCWEQVSPPLESDLEGQLVWDCEVCCKPWLITISRDVEGNRQVTVERAQN